MKMKIWIPIILALVLILFLLVPIPRQFAYDDGGTKEYVALTYKIVDWNRMYGDGVYDKTCIYFGNNRNKSIDELWELESQNIEEKFSATILEINRDSVLVEPNEGEPERLSSDKIFIMTTHLEKINVEVGSVVQITYQGGIMESYPAQIVATSWSLSGDFQNVEYTEQWVEKTEDNKEDNEYIAEHIIVTKIYSNCFFARAVIPMPYEIKINGSISNNWCVGDQVSCTYKNVYYDKLTHHIEADLVTIKVSDWQPQPDVAYKPVIYLYPQKETKVNVKLELDGRLTCTYPAYESGWEVTAKPDGTLTDVKGQKYNYLYWEGETNVQYDLLRGFCVKGEDTAAFLESALNELGLNRREANEFIVYWLPLMEQNKYNVISFQTDRYTKAAKLDIDPAPDTMIRVFMAWRASDEYVKMEKQELSAPIRNGFTVVEWGGTQVNN